MKNNQINEKLIWHKPEMQKLFVNHDTENAGSLPPAGLLDMAAEG